ncbi:MAG TPA: hypothetical protein VIJ14_02685, partial [Rhabdochlamydiaceae bacterium]
MDKRTIIFVVLMTATFYAVNHFLFPSKPAAAAPAPIVQTAAASPIARTPSQAPSSSDEMLYVIQNKYQQLVVSSINGAIAEINLPFESKENPDSVVRKIRVDTILEKDYPKKDRYPAAAYQTHEGTFNEGTVDNFYPLLRRNVDPQFYAMATLTSDPASAATVFKMTKLEKNVIQMEGTTNGTRITKTYTLPEDESTAPYSFDMTIQVDGNSQDLSLTTGVPEVEIVSGSSTQSLKYRMTRNQKGAVEQLSLPKTATTVSSVVPDWIANSNGFFAIILDPQTEMSSGFTAYKIPGSDVPTRLTMIDSQYDLYPAANYPGYDMRLPFKNSSA